MLLAKSILKRKELNILEQRIKKEVLTIIPVYNVGEKVTKLRFNETYDVLFIDDGSTDLTEHYLKQLNYNYFVNDKNEGIVFCMRKGLQYAKKAGYRYIVTIDGDGQHLTNVIDCVIENLKNGVKFIHGVRKLYDFAKVPSTKICSNFAAAYILYKSSGRFIEDVTCGIKGLEINLMNDILEQIESEGYTFSIECLMYVLKKEVEYNIVYVPAIYYPSDIWATRGEELRSFYYCIKKYYPDFLYMREYYNFVFHHYKSLKIDQFIFYQYYFENIDLSLIQCQMSSINKFLENQGII